VVTPIGSDAADNRFTPRYYQIELELRARIAERVVGDLLPSDADLSREFGVSRMTVRQAFQALVQEGLVDRRPGSGTYVADTAAHRKANVLVGFSDEARRMGRVPSSRLLAKGTRVASHNESVVLALDPGASVAFIDRLRLSDEQPIAIEHAVICERAAVVLDYDLETGSLHGAFRQEGFVPNHGRATISAAPAGADEAGLLDVNKGDPLLVESRLIFDADGFPIEFTESRYVADRYDLKVDFVVEAG